MNSENFISDENVHDLINGMLQFFFIILPINKISLLGILYCSDK